MHVNIEDSWKLILKDEFEKPYFSDLVAYLREQKKLGKLIYPKGTEIFNAFLYTPFNELKVVILGQDPYHGEGQAHGLCFSVPRGIPLPPSLLNIFKELKTDLNIEMPSSGDLTPWAKQGVLLLNTSLTVEKAMPMSHSKIGWEQFTNAIIKNISQHQNHVVFILWGRFAQQKISFIDTSKHLILSAAHPSPLSAHNGFWNCKHFSKSNEYLIQNGKVPINWSLS